MCVKSASIAFSSLDFDDAKRLNSPNAFHQTSKQKAIWLHIKKIFCVRTARRIKTAEKQKLRPKNKLFFGRSVE